MNLISVMQYFNSELFDDVVIFDIQESMNNNEAWQTNKLSEEENRLLIMSVKRMNVPEMVSSDLRLSPEVKAK
jgi:hypothetical protein